MMIPLRVVILRLRRDKRLHIIGAFIVSEKAKAYEAQTTKFPSA